MGNLTQHIKKRIQKELSNHSIKYAHGITKDNIQDHLVEPRMDSYIGSINSDETFEVWTVLKEHPNEQRGYTIFYQEEEGKFGLGTHHSDELIYIGLYGSFIDTLNSI